MTAVEGAAEFCCFRLFDFWDRHNLYFGCCTASKMAFLQKLGNYIGKTFGERYREAMGHRRYGMSTVFSVWWYVSQNEADRFFFRSLLWRLDRWNSSCERGYFSSSRASANRTSKKIQDCFCSVCQRNNFTKGEMGDRSTRYSLPSTLHRGGGTRNFRSSCIQVRISVDSMRFRYNTVTDLLNAWHKILWKKIDTFVCLKPTNDLQWTLGNILLLREINFHWIWSTLLAHYPILKNSSELRTNVVVPFSIKVMLHQHKYEA